MTRSSVLRLNQTHRPASPFIILWVFNATHSSVIFNLKTHKTTILILQHRFSLKTFIYLKIIVTQSYFRPLAHSQNGPHGRWQPKVPLHADTAAQALGWPPFCPVPRGISREQSELEPVLRRDVGVAEGTSQWQWLYCYFRTIHPLCSLCPLRQPPGPQHWLTSFTTPLTQIQWQSSRQEAD